MKNKIFLEFIKWTNNKFTHHININRTNLYFKEKEIWWAALGKNIGFELDGKYDLFERPILILKKYSKDTCFILPLTTKIKNLNPWYQFIVNIDGKTSAINIAQGRVISSKRLLRKKSLITKVIFNKIKLIFKEQL